MGKPTQSPAISAEKQALLEAEAEYLIPCIRHFYAEPLWIVRAAGAHVYDEQDRAYLDGFSGVGVVNCGHANPEILSAREKCSARLDHTTTIYLTEPMVRLAQRLAELTPGDLKRSFFCSSGSEANEAAALVAMLSTGRESFLAFDRGLHGRTLLTMNLTGLEMWRTKPALEDRVTHLPTPDCYRCPFGERFPGCGLRCAREAAATIDREGPETFAAMFFEPVLGNGGIVVPPPGYMEALAELLARHGILLIADEMQTGFGRTGRWFGTEHHGVAPQLMSVAKALANGTPIGAVIATDAVAGAYTRPGASTFGGNGTSTSAALATLDYIERHHLVERAARLGEFLIDQLRELMPRHACCGDLRGLGLMLGLELVAPDGSPAGALADEVLESLRERGFLLGKTGPGRNVLTFMPPLVVEKRDLEDLTNALCEVLALRSVRR